MIIDNFELLSELYRNNVHAPKSDSFIFGQIMVRKKDGSRFSRSNNKIIRDIIFDTPEDFHEKKEEVITLATSVGARVYINPNPRFYSEIAISMAGVCLDHIRNGSQRAVRGAFSTACGKYKTPRSMWIIDVDDGEALSSVESYIPDHYEYTIVPTVNGHHILVQGFDVRELRTTFPDMDIHKNNPTLLYFNDESITT